MDTIESTSPHDDTIKDYIMQILSTILLTLPLALASPTVRGCGTIVDKTGLGQTLMSDEKCNYIGKHEAKSINVGDGCLCITFNTDECSTTKAETWSYLVEGPHTNIDLSKRGTQWYQCSTDISWSEVSAVVYGCVCMVANKMQSWISKYTKAYSQNVKNY